MEAELQALYDEYVDGYRDGDGRLPAMMALKYEHTMKVVENALAIADGEGFNAVERRGAFAAGLLHDTGRYEQLRRFNTFRDSDSVDHAVFSYEIVRDRDWLGRLEDVRRDGLVEPVLNAVLYHNRRDLPEHMDSLTATLARTVRDADKLDIFRVLEHQFKFTDWKHDSRAFWNLPWGVAPSAEVVDAIRERRPVDYQYIRSLADFVLIQVGWMISGLEYSTTRRLTAERRHLEFRRNFLREVGGGAAAEALCDTAAEVLGDATAAARGR